MWPLTMNWRIGWRLVWVRGLQTASLSCFIPHMFIYSSLLPSLAMFALVSFDMHLKCDFSVPPCCIYAFDIGHTYVFVIRENTFDWLLMCQMWLLRRRKRGQMGKRERRKSSNSRRGVEYRKKGMKDRGLVFEDSDKSVWNVLQQVVLGHREDFIFPISSPLPSKHLPFSFTLLLSPFSSLTFTQPLIIILFSQNDRMERLRRISWKTENRWKGGVMRHVQPSPRNCLYTYFLIRS